MRGGPCGPFGNMMKMFMSGASGACPQGTEQPKAQEQEAKEPEVKEPELPEITVVSTALSEGAVLSPSQTAIQTWSLNTGSTEWPEDAKLIFVRGDREISLEEEFPQPNGQMGTCEVSAVIQAPGKPGRYSAVFQLADKDRTVFGPRLSVEIIVEATAEVKEPESKEWVKVNDGASPPPSAPASPVNKYAEQQEQLRALGFTDETLNSDLLEMHQGNIQAVVEYLFK